jgi:hypothetical protein
MVVASVSWPNCDPDTCRDVFRWGLGEYRDFCDEDGIRNQGVSDAPARTTTNAEALNVFLENIYFFPL